MERTIEADMFAAAERGTGGTRRTWYTATDPQNGRMYYYNELGQTQWEEPVELHEGTPPLWRIDGMGEHTRFSIYVDPFEPINLGRRQLGSQFKGISRAQAVLWCDDNGLLAIKSHGLNPTSLLSAGQQKWEQLFNGMKHALGPDDCIALDPSYKEGTKFVVNPTPEGLERLKKLASEQGLTTPQLTARTVVTSPRPIGMLGGPPAPPKANESMASRIARRRWETANSRMDLHSPRGYHSGSTPRHSATFGPGDKVFATRSNGESQVCNVVKFDSNKGSYLLEFDRGGKIMHKMARAVSGVPRSHSSLDEQPRRAASRLS